MTISLATDIIDELTEMKRRVQVEQNPEAKHTERCIGEVQHIEEITTCEHPLHHKGIEDEPIEDAHAETALCYGCSHTKSKQPQYESIRRQDVEIEENDAIGPYFEPEYVPKEAETDRNDNNMYVVCQ